MSITGREVYILHHAITLHFTSKQYDFFKYQGKLSGNGINYNTTPGKTVYQTIAKKWSKDDIIDRFFSVLFFAKNKPTFIKDFLSQDADIIVNTWKKRNQSISYTFGNDLDTINDSGISRHTFNVISGDHPKIFKLMTTGKIGKDSVVILNKYLGFIDKWITLSGVDPYFTSTALKLYKAKPFIEPFVTDDIKMKNIIKSRLTI